MHGFISINVQLILKYEIGILLRWDGIPGMGFHNSQIIIKWMDWCNKLS